MRSRRLVYRFCVTEQMEADQQESGTASFAEGSAPEERQVADDASRRRLGKSAAKLNPQIPRKRRESRADRPSEVGRKPTDELETGALPLSSPNFTNHSSESI
jgi:hypothetical protein